MTYRSDLIRVTAEAIAKVWRDWTRRHRMSLKTWWVEAWAKPLDVSRAEASLAIADLCDELAIVWDDTLGKWAGPSKLRGWAVHRREVACQVLQEWPVSMGGTGPEWPQK